MLRVVSQRIVGTDDELCACFMDWRERKSSSNLYMERNVKTCLVEGQTVIV